MRQFAMLALIAVGCLALGVYLHANLLNVAIGLAVGGGVGGVLMFLIRKLSPPDEPK